MRTIAGGSSAAGLGLPATDVGPIPAKHTDFLPDMLDATHKTMVELEAGLTDVRRSPSDGGELQLIVRRPAPDEREILDIGRLDGSEGLAGDGWSVRLNARSNDGSPNPETQLTIMNSRFAEVVALQRERWPLAGDQLYADLDLSEDNLPSGTRLAIGEAVVEITPQPHTGCAKFAQRFGADALRFVSSQEGRRLRLRGVYAIVVQAGRIRVGDTFRKIGTDARVDPQS